MSGSVAAARPGTDDRAEVAGRLVVAARRRRSRSPWSRRSSRSRGRRSRPSRRRPPTVTAPTPSRPSAPTHAVALGRPPGRGRGVRRDHGTRPVRHAGGPRRRRPGRRARGAAADHVRASCRGACRRARRSSRRSARAPPPSSPRRPPWFDALLWGNDAAVVPAGGRPAARPGGGARGVPRAGHHRRRVPRVQPGEPGHRRRHLDGRARDRGAGRLPVDRAGGHALRRGDRGPRVPRPHARREHHRHVDGGGAHRRATADAALATLGDPADLSAMVQDRAQAAVRSLG